MSEEHPSRIPYGTAQVPIDSDRGAGVEVPLKQKLEQLVIHARNEARRIFIARYHEIIVNLRDYKNVPTSFNKYVIENWLRQNYQVAVGKDAMGRFQMLGYLANKYTITNAQAPFAIHEATKNEICWTLPYELIPTKKDYHEITQLDDATTGDFVILRNKPVTETSDYEVIDFYANQVAELMASRISLIIQAKATTTLPVEMGDTETANQIVAALYNGQPYLEVNDAMDLSQMLAMIGDASVPERIKSLKQSLTDLTSEMNNFLGINSLGVDKNSGVSSQEVDANNDYVSSIDNMYERGPQEGFDLYNKRFGTDYQVKMQQPDVAQMVQMKQDSPTKDGDGGDGSADNNDA